MIRALVAVALFFLAATVAVRADERWIVINDIHLNPYDRSDHPHRGVDTNEALWQITLAQLRKEPAPDVVVLGGDMLAHHFDSITRSHGEDPTAAGVRTIRGIAGSLAHAFPRAQFLIALGNNDDPCGDYRSETGGPYQRQLETIFAPLVNRNGSAPNFAAEFMRGGYYAVRLPKSGRTAIVLNSVLWSFVYRGGCSSSGANAGAQEFAWLSNELPRTQHDVIVMHVPPGYDPQSTTIAHRILAVPFMSSASDRRFLDLMDRNHDRVAFILAAHTHRYDFRIAGGVPVLIASSISPIYRNQPAFFELAVAADGSLRDVVPMTYDPWEESWDRAPSFDATYDVNALTASNLERTSQRIGSDEGVRRKWIAAYDVWSYRMGDISDHAWRVFWCAQTELGDGYGACAGTQRRTNSVVALAALAVLAVLLIVLFAVRRMIIERR